MGEGQSCAQQNGLKTSNRVNGVQVPSLMFYGVKGILFMIFVAIDRLEIPLFSGLAARTPELRERTSGVVKISFPGLYG